MNERLGPAPRSPLVKNDVEVAYRKHAHCVLRRATRLLGSEAEGREVVQEVFLSLWERPEAFNGQSSLLTFLYSATTHRCLNRLREGATQKRLLQARAEIAAEPLSPSPELGLELERLLRELPEELAAVAVYVHLDGLSYDEVASVMGCSRRKVAYLIEQLRTLTERRAHVS
jgi:RNA polymerase sigma-70 factor (ECF subfamily)